MYRNVALYKHIKYKVLYYIYVMSTVVNPASPKSLGCAKRSGPLLNCNLKINR